MLVDKKSQVCPHPLEAIVTIMRREGKGKGILEAGVLSRDRLELRCWQELLGHSYVLRGHVGGLRQRPLRLCPAPVCPG